MAPFIERISNWSCIVALVLCAAMHLTTFLAPLAPIWILIPFFLVALAITCDRSIRRRLPSIEPVTGVGWLQIALLAYAVGTFIYFYQTTGGATGVGVRDGQYVSLYKSKVLRVISEEDFRRFPSLWTRVMSAWIAMMAVAGLRKFQAVVRLSQRPSHPRDWSVGKRP